MLAELPGRAEREPVVGDGEGGDRDDRDRRGGRGASSSRASASWRRRHDRLRGGRRARVGADPRRDRPDRRLAEREARHALLLALDRGRRRAGDGGRPLRLREGLRLRRGVDGRARRRRAPERRAARRRSAEGRRSRSSPSRRRCTSYVAEKAAAMVGIAHRLRIMGCLALSLCHLAAGRLDGVVSLKPARSVDIAAGQLLVRERGLAIELPRGAAVRAAPLDLEARSRLVAAGTPELCDDAWRSALRRLIRIGCSGWNYAHWRDASSIRRGWPAARAGSTGTRSHFDTVEINMTFYRLPKVEAVARAGSRRAPTASSSRSRSAATSRTSSGCRTSGPGSGRSSSGSSRCSAARSSAPSSGSCRRTSSATTSASPRR